MDRDALEKLVLHHIAEALVQGETPYFYGLDGWGPKDVGWLFGRPLAITKLVPRLRKLVGEYSWGSICLEPSCKKYFSLTVADEAWYGELRGPAGKRQIIIRPYAFPIIIVDPASHPALR